MDVSVSQYLICTFQRGRLFKVHNFETNSMSDLRGAAHLCLQRDCFNLGVAVARVFILDDHSVPELVMTVYPYGFESKEVP